MLLRRGLIRTALALLLCAVASSAALPARAADLPERVPEQVARYFDEGLLPRLTELYAPSEDGSSGIDFGESARVGEVLRLRTWTAAFLAGAEAGEGAGAAEDAAAAVELTNEWVAPVLVGDLAVGTALVWINPGLQRAELAEFYPGAGLADAIRSRSPEGVLVRHAPSASWFVVTDASATPLIAGTTGVSADVALADLPPSLVPPQPEVPEQRGAAVPALLLVVAFVAIVGVLLRASRRRDGGSTLGA